jgi:hypothetical protein
MEPLDDFLWPHFERLWPGILELCPGTRLAGGYGLLLNLLGNWFQPLPPVKEDAG